MLKGIGYEVVSAGNGVEALEKLRTESIDMIISDVLMPVMDGFKFCKEVKEKDELKNIPFIFYTATYKDEKDEKLALKLGADKYILKPMDPEELIKIIQGAIRDVEEGKFEPKKPAFEEEQEVFKLYSERLVNKLEKKMLDLEKEITVRKEAEEALRQRTHDLGKRVKELSCLFEIDEITRKEGLTVEEVLEKTVRIIPPSWQYPEITGSCITFENRKYKTKNFKETKWMQRVDIIVNAKKAGLVEVCYLEEKPEDYEGPFLKEERDLIKGIVERLAQFIEHKHAEEEIRASLKEKEVLLQEVHHRVKNNMQIISSLFNLQSGRIKDKQAFEIFKSSQNRVRSMALIHERLYQSKDLTRVDFAEYSQSLTTHLFSSYGINPGIIKLHINIKDVFLDINTTIPCSLIINELVSNSLKYAFPENKKGEIKIAIHTINKNEIELIVSDNGVGLPKKMDFRKTDSLGLHLVNLLAEDQLHGEIKLDRTEGTSFHIKFKVKR
jgi:two-component sensor histidine kinase/CheY-like chemotaxis protein